MTEVSTDEYPLNDTEFEDHVLTKVEAGEDGWFILHDGLGFFCPNISPIEPRPGMTARFYGKGLGSRVRGLFLNGRKVFYRTEAEDREKFEIDLYGADAADWLRRWDAGKTCWSIEMGGLGPGYEQCIQITAAEVLRHMLAEKYDHTKWGEKEGWTRDREKIEKFGFADKTISQLGLSGAQWGAATNLACHIYMDGPRKMLAHPDVQDRKIQVSNNMRMVA